MAQPSPMKRGRGLLRAESNTGRPAHYEEMRARGFGAASAIAERKQHPKTGKFYPVIRTKQQYASLPAGKTYFSAAKGQFFKKSAA